MIVRAVIKTTDDSDYPLNFVLLREKI